MSDVVSRMSDKMRSSLQRAELMWDDLMRCRGACAKYIRGLAIAHPGDKPDEAALFVSRALNPHNTLYRFSIL